MSISVETDLIWLGSEMEPAHAIPEIPIHYWEAPSPVISAALDDPLTGLIVFDRELQAVHITSQVKVLLRLPANASLEFLSILQVLQSAALEVESAASAQASIIALADGRTVPKPLLLNICGSPEKVTMRLRHLGSGYGLATFAITEPPVKQEKQDMFATLDSLTNLMSRSAFESAVRGVLARTPDETFSILLLDLDRFKPVNDSLGHATGDTVLRLVAKRLQAAVRNGNLVARFGGDEFAILSKHARTIEAHSSVALRILDVLQRTYVVDGNIVNIGVSIGIARYPQHGGDCAELLRSADLALYHSKTSGRAMFQFFEPKLATQAEAKRTQEVELRRALALQQLEVHYQPQVHIETGRLIGFEALVRWRHPTRGLVPPCDFLPLAEEIGLIIPLGNWVLRTACREAMKWDEGVTIAVNASPLQFEAGQFAESVAKALESTGLPGTRLEIEITEGILLRNEDAVLATLAKLRQMGVQIAMDDFGTGYASLSQLARFPFDKIKIDRSLAGGEGDHPKNRAIIRAIAALGASLGVATMAEGVESGEQLQRLRSDGCSSVQGYYFSRPIPAHEIDALIIQLGAQARIQDNKDELL